MSAIRNFYRDLMFALCKLHQIQFSAPWAPRRGGC